MTVIRGGKDADSCLTIDRRLCILLLFRGFISIFQLVRSSSVRGDLQLTAIVGERLLESFDERVERLVGIILTRPECVANLLLGERVAVGLPEQFHQLTLHGREVYRLAVVEKVLGVGTITEVANHRHNIGRDGRSVRADKGSCRADEGWGNLLSADTRQESHDEAEQCEQRQRQGQPLVREAKHRRHGAIGIATQIIALSAMLPQHLAAAYRRVPLVGETIRQGGALAQHGILNQRAVGAHGVRCDIFRCLHFHGEHQCLVEVACHVRLRDAIAVQAGKDGQYQQRKACGKAQFPHLVSMMLLFSSKNKCFP